MVENQKVVKVIYDLYIKGEKPNTENIIEQATEENPLTYCHGENMMLPKFEEALMGKEVGDHFDFYIQHTDAYGEYDEEGEMTLDREMFEIDGKFDDKRVFVGNIIPKNTTDGQTILAQVIEITDEKVTINLNHPLAGEDLHFIGKIIDIRDASQAELQAIRNKGHHCGCNGNCNSDCNGCNNDCNGNCQ